MKKEYLNGKVIVESFSKEKDDLGRFRGGDERGEVTMFLADTEVNFVEFVEFNGKDIKRGFHYHKEYKEYLYVIKGQLTFTAQVIEGNDSLKLTLHEGELLTISPGIAHAFSSLEQSLAISAGFGPSPFIDRHHYPIVV